MTTARPLYLDKQAVCEFVALSEATVENLVRLDKFPKPRLLSGRRVGWLVRELVDWAESRPVSDLPPPKNTGWRRVSAAAQAAPASHRAS